MAEKALDAIVVTEIATEAALAAEAEISLG